MKNLLVTTALEDTWGDGDEHLIFLGEWCRSYDRKDVWGKRSHEVMPYHWTDREKFAKDYDYLEGLYERVLIQLSFALNKHHGLNKPVLYWRTIVGTWLLTYLAILWDRWESLRIVAEKCDYSEIILLDVDQKETVPVDYTEFTDFMNTHLWNMSIFEKIIKYKGLEGVKCHARGRRAKQLVARNVWKRKILYIINRVISWVPIKEKIVFSKSYFSLKDFIALSVRLKQFPCWHLEFEEVLDSANNKFHNTHLSNDRNIDLKLDCKNEFEHFLSLNVFNQLPILLVEGFSYLCKNAENIKTNADLIFSSNSHWSNLFFNTWMADNVINGKRFISSVHGGSMRGKYSIFGHEEKISYKKVVWHVPYNIKHKQLPPHKITKTNRPKYSGKNLLVIGLEFPIYSYRIQSGPGADLLLENIQLNIDFYALLNIIPKENLRMKPALSNLGWNTRKRYKDEFSEHNIVYGKSLKKEMEKSKIIVCTYPQTTLSDAMHSGVPTILLYPEKYWEVEEVFDELIQAIKDAKIVFSDAKKAARHINEIWSDPQEWWESSKVSSAREMFFSMCGRTNPNWIDEWSLFFKDELKK